MAVSAIYFNFQIPHKELTILRERSDVLRNQQINQEKYKRTLNDVMQVFNKLDSGSSKAMVESELTVKMDALRSAASIEDSTAVQKLNQMVFTLVSEYSKAKFKLFDFSSYDEELRKRNETIQQLRATVEDYKNRLNFNNQ